MNINVPRALCGISLITAGIMGLISVYNDCRKSNAPEVNPASAEVTVDEYDHSVELPPVSEDDSVGSDPLVDAQEDGFDEDGEVLNPDPNPTPLVDAYHMDPAIAAAVFITPVKPAFYPKEQAAAKVEEVPSVGKLMSPKDISHLQRISDLLYARAVTNNWDLRFPVVEQNGVLWRKSEYKVPAGLTLSMVVFTKGETPILYARGNLILDTLSREDQIVLRRKDSIIKSITAPTAFPPNATPIGVGTTVTMKSYVRKNRAYFGIPLKLVLSDGDPRLDACLMITTTSGQTLPSIERLIPVAMEATMGLFIAARASRLIDTKNIILSA